MLDMVISLYIFIDKKASKTAFNTYNLHITDYYMVA